MRKINLDCLGISIEKLGKEVSELIKEDMDYGRGRAVYENWTQGANNFNIYQNKEKFILVWGVWKDKYEYVYTELENDEFIVPLTGIKRNENEPDEVLIYKNREENDFKKSPYSYKKIIRVKELINKGEAK